MTILRVRVKTESTRFQADTVVSAPGFVFLMSGRVTRDPGYGNLYQVTPRTYPQSGQFFDLNNPGVAGTVSVSSYSPVYFSSADLKAQAGLIGQMAAFIDRDYLEFTTQTVPGTPLTRTDLEAFL